jgi:hypothetical protein
MKTKCENCKYWDDFGDEEDATPREGYCRRFPPQHNGVQEIDTEPMHSYWRSPVTGGHWWCGEFSQRVEIAQ